MYCSNHVIGWNFLGYVIVIYDRIVIARSNLNFKYVRMINICLWRIYFWCFAQRIHNLGVWRKILLFTYKTALKTVRRLIFFTAFFPVGFENLWTLSRYSICNYRLYIYLKNRNFDFGWKWIVSFYYRIKLFFFF